MKKLLSLFVLSISCIISIAQNLVPNGDFEQYSGCPTAAGGLGLAQLDSALFWMNPASGQQGGSPDYFNQCTSGFLNVPNTFFGYQQAHSGGAFCGIALWGGNNPETREYVEAPLTSILIANNCYHFEMYINSPESMQYVTDDIQVYFSDTAITGINNYQPLPLTPQITNSTGNIPDITNWTLVSGNYTASGGEQYLIIGNFKNDAVTSTILINNLVQWPDAYVFIDDVSLSLCTGINENHSHASIHIFPNPLTTTLNVTISYNELSEIILYDIASRKLLSQEFTKSVSLNTEMLAKGIYIYELRNKTGLIKQGRIVKE